MRIVIDHELTAVNIRTNGRCWILACDRIVEAILAYTGPVEIFQHQLYGYCKECSQPKLKGSHFFLVTAL